MERVVEAFYEDGVFKPLEDPALDDHVRVVLTIKEKGEEKPRERPRKRTFGSAKGLIEMADDFDEPLEDFREYME